MLTIDRLDREDLGETADLHHRYLHMGLFPRMGKGFLRHYQDTFAESPYGIALVARDEEGVVGALFGTSWNSQHYRWVLRNRGPELAAFGSLALMLRPHIAYVFARSRLGRYAKGARRHLASGSDGSSSFTTEGPLSVLSHIVTQDGQRRCGVGRQLVEEFRRLARVRGAREAVLVTEEGGLGAPFFERIGCECIACRDSAEGRSVREYRLTLDRTVRHDERLSPLDRSRSLVRSERNDPTNAGAFSGTHSDGATIH
ncbi:MAG TPA: hypothetical protein VGO22_06635 [Pseudorhizobium sp.]|nr:hypothetical protein [Pseudorhizobium sp.]